MGKLNNEEDILKNVVVRSNTRKEIVESEGDDDGDNPIIGPLLLSLQQVSLAPYSKSSATLQTVLL